MESKQHPYAICMDGILGLRNHLSRAAGDKFKPSNEIFGNGFSNMSKAHSFCPIFNRVHYYWTINNIELMDNQSGIELEQARRLIEAMCDELAESL